MPSNQDFHRAVKVTFQTALSNLARKRKADTDLVVLESKNSEECLGLPLDCWLAISEFVGCKAAQWVRFRLVCRSLHIIGGDPAWLSTLQPKITQYDMHILPRFLPVNYLHFAGCVPEDTVSRLALFGHLKTLKFDGHCFLTDAGMQTLATTLPVLRNLKIKFCSGITDIAIESLALLTRLETLSLTDCNKISSTGFLKLSTLNRLRKLDLAHTLIDDVGLPMLSNLTRLEYLSLSGTRVEGDGLDVLSNLQSLTHLSLKDCTTLLIGISVVEKLLCLKYLNLRSTWLQQDIEVLTRLKTLEVYSSAQGGPLVRNCVNLKALKVDANNDHEGIESFTQLQKLSSESPANDLLIPSLHASLTKLNLQDCFSMTNDGMRALSVLTALTTMELYNLRQVNNISSLGCLTRLKKLNLESCRHKDNEMRVFSGLTNITKLSLAGCRLLTDQCIDYLAPLEKLDSLYLNHCSKITDVSVPRFTERWSKTHARDACFPSLFELSLSGCNISKPQRAKLDKCGLKAWWEDIFNDDDLIEFQPIDPVKYRGFVVNVMQDSDSTVNELTTRLCRYIPASSSCAPSSPFVFSSSTSSTSSSSSCSNPFSSHPLLDSESATDSDSEADNDVPLFPPLTSFNEAGQEIPQGDDDEVYWIDEFTGPAPRTIDEERLSEFVTSMQAPHLSVDDYETLIEKYVREEMAQQSTD